MTRRLFDRTCRTTIGRPGQTGKAWPGGNDGLRTSFTVEKTPDKATNSLKLSLYNLNPDSRGWISSEDMIVSLEAGYDGRNQGLFYGDINRVNHKTEGNSGDIITEIEAGDGSKALQQSTVQKSYPKNTNPEKILGDFASALGSDNGASISEGFTEQIGNITGAKNGFSASGSVEKNLDTLLAGTEYDWSIQDSELEIVGPGGVKTGNVLLNYESGLLRTNRLEGGKIEIVSLLMGLIKPNRPLRLDEEPEGVYLVKNVTHEGDTGGGDEAWTTTAEVTPR